MKSEILRQLKDAGDFISGQELCETFHVSRTAVWKAIHQLLEEGHEIEAVRNKGYRLTDRNDILSEAELAASLAAGEPKRNLVYKKTVDSTNNLARMLAEQGAAHGTLVAADVQTAGKGRRGRGWDSPSGTGIWMSLILRPFIPPHRASAVTLVAALAVQKALCEKTGVAAQIKWPNDIVIHGRKVCGILTEMSSDMDSIHYVITGIGINVNQTKFPEEIAGTATSLRLETGQIIRRAGLIGEILHWFERYCEQFLRTGDMSLLQKDYMASMVNLNQKVVVLDPKGTWEGIATGISSGGELLVRAQDGNIRSVGSGEVSVRGVYGYA